MKYKLALITGAAGGLGKEFSKHLAEQGTDLILTDVSSASLKPIQADLEKVMESKSKSYPPIFPYRKAGKKFYRISSAKS